MLYLRIGALAALLALSLGAVYSQEPKAGDKKTARDEPPVGKVRGQLPQNFKKLGLRDDQVQKIYRIQADYKAKIEDLKRQMERLKDEQKAAVEKVLTPEQQKRLRELRTGEKSENG